MKRCLRHATITKIATEPASAVWTIPGEEPDRVSPVQPQPLQRRFRPSAVTQRGVIRTTRIGGWALSCNLGLLALAAILWGFPLTCHAVKLWSPPSFTQATNAPLAGVLQLTTDVDSRVGVSVNDGQAVWERNFYDYATVHSVPLLGFKPGRTNQITVTVYDRNGNRATDAQPMVFVTPSLPSDFPNITLLKSDPEKMEPGYTLFGLQVFNLNAYTVIVDSEGGVVWYSAHLALDVRLLANGDLFLPWPTSFEELNLLGQTVQSWSAPILPVDVHDAVPTDHGTILYLTDALKPVSNLPTSATDPEAALTNANVLSQNVVEIAATNSTVLNTWSPVDVLDARRITYLFTPASDGLPDWGWDTEHANAVIEDPSDNSLVVSMRNQNAVVKISRATGGLVWILGPPENWGPEWQPYLLTPVGAPFAWQYGQHAPVFTGRGTLMVYDDGNYRGSPFGPYLPDSNNYSRAVEYRIDQRTMQVSQVWAYGSTNAGEWLYTAYEGNAEPEPKTGNVLINFSAVSVVDGAPPCSQYPNAVMARFKEVTHEPVPQVVFDLAITMYDKGNPGSQSCAVYRAHRIPDLYAHPATAVADLTVNSRDGLPLLQFSGDDTRTYLIQSSSNLVDWETIGPPIEDSEQFGEFEFQDTTSTQRPHRYYRVLTK